MPLTPGTRLAQYDVVSRLGAGGMGEVYRARDMKLGREVALKVLPEAVTDDPERLARFRREAQVLAALNHPHIGAIYGFEEDADPQFLVLELVEGETLAARLQRGPLTLSEALDVAREIASALEAAHERGIVHRDLKPSNIAFSADGTVKVLDFGLARPNLASADVNESDAVNSPTITSPLTLTRLGVILGTAAYMSPEQAKGAVVDKRSDVWAFGCVLYEMLTGRRAFEGDDVTDTLAAVIRSHPDWTALPASLPLSVRAVLEGCLEKDRRKRIADLSVARFVLERQPSDAAADRRPRNARLAPVAALLLAGVMVGAAAAAWWHRAETQPPVVTRFTLPLEQDRALAATRRSITISPDGSRVAYTSGNRLFVRSISEFDARPIAIPSGAIQPTFSPDGESIAFWGDGLLQRLPINGGFPATVSPVSPAPFSITWGDGGILFVEQGRGIMRVAGRGAPDVLLARNDADGLPHAAQLLPDGDTLLFALGRLVSPSANFWDTAQIVAHSLKTGRRKLLIDGGNNPLYLPSGHLVYAVEGTLMAVPFDVSNLEVLGSPVAVVEGVRRTAAAAGGEAHFAVSRSGTLVYVGGPARAGEEKVFLYTPDGKAEPLALPTGRYAYPRISPDARWVALEMHDGREAAVGVYHLSGATALRRLTFEKNNRYPIWSGDGRRVVFQSDREGDLGIFWQSLEGGTAERLTRAEAGVSHIPESWSPKSDVLLYSATRDNVSELWALDLSDRRSSRFGGVTSAVFPTNSMFSPDGRWVAYQQGKPESGEAATYVQPFPPTGTKYQIAQGGRPVWARDGKALFFVPAPNRFAGVTVTTSGTFSFSAPASLPRPFGLSPPANPRNYDTLPGGRMIGINTPGDSSAAWVIYVVQNWFEELKTRVPRPR